MWNARLAALELLGDLREKGSITENAFQSEKLTLLAGDVAAPLAGEVYPNAPLDIQSDNLPRSNALFSIIRLAKSGAESALKGFTKVLSKASGRALAMMAFAALVGTMLIWNLVIEPVYVSLFRASSSQLSPTEYESKCGNSFSECEGLFIDWTGQVSTTGSDVHVDAGEARLKLPNVDGSALGLVKGQRVRFSGYLEEGGLFSYNELAYPKIEALETAQSVEAREAAADAAYERKQEREFDKARPDFGACYVMSQGNASAAANCERSMRQTREMRGY